MEAFPFTETEWASVSDAALLAVNAGSAGDAVLRASHLIGLLDVLADLRVRHGEHPALLETEADFTDDGGERLALYRRVTDLAAANGLQTLTIRLSVAQVLLELGRAAEASTELSACEGELPGGDDSDRVSWSELVAEAGRGA